ncbi:MAG: archease [Anaerolineae bacterium]|nr:archease [Anaerolineae bacterium]
MPYEYLDHQADLGIRGIGPSPQEAFSEGAQAMLAAMADLDGIRPTFEWSLCCAAPDLASLFVEWLNELLYQREIHGALLASAQVIELEQTAEGWTLAGVARGEPIDLARHTIYTEVKAATYSGLDYRQDGELYIVQCVVDL